MIKPTIIICTYRREKNVIANINILNNKCRLFIQHIYVIDNASSLPKSLSNDFITIIANRNLGGSGGYARGMYEARKDKNCTHLFFMDDDIKFDYQTLKRAVDKLNAIGKNDWFAFGMRTFEHQDRLYENTAYWTGVRIKSNYRSNPYPYLKKKNNKKCNYAGWWALIMPISVIKKYGYPMPYFIKSDDIEYGMRMQKGKIVCDNNITVLHEDFDKKNNKIIDYYNIRNHIITDLLHFKHSLEKVLLVFSLRMIKAWMTGKFSKLEMSLLGVKDLFLGSSFFKQNIEKNNLRIQNESQKIRFNFLKFLIYPFIIIYYSFLLILKHRQLKLDYVSNYKYLTSEEFWIRQFSDELPN